MLSDGIPELMKRLPLRKSSDYMSEGMFASNKADVEGEGNDERKVTQYTSIWTYIWDPCSLL